MSFKIFLVATLKKVKRNEINFNYIYIFLILFIYLFLAVFGLHCCMRAFSSCCERAGFSLQWLLLLRSTGSRCAGFSSCGTWAQ